MPSGALPDAGGYARRPVRPISVPMESLAAVFPWLIGAALAATLAVLLIGLVSMFRGGAFNRRNANKLMRWRVGLQALAVLLLAVFFLFVRS